MIPEHHRGGWVARYHHDSYRSGQAVLRQKSMELFLESVVVRSAASLVNQGEKNKKKKRYRIIINVNAKIIQKIIILIPIYLCKSVSLNINCPSAIRKYEQQNMYVV